MSPAKKEPEVLDDHRPRPTALTPEVVRELRRPFTAAAVKFKPQAVSKDGTKALATFYVDARLVMERLNHVVGPENWTNEPTVLFESNPQAHQAFQFPVQQALTVFGVRKVDVGVYMQGSTADDKAIKSAYSDSLKRAAVMFGIGAYLYALPKQWFDFERGPNGKGGKWKNEAAIRKAYEGMIAKLGIGAPIDHGDLEDHETEPAEDPAPAEPGAARRETKPKPAGEVKADFVSDKAEVDRMVALAKAAGYSKEDVVRICKNEHDAHGGYRKVWLVEQLQHLNQVIAEKAAA